MKPLRAVKELLKRPAKKPFHVALNAHSQKQLKLTPISSFLDEDVFLLGYPKSGHAWCQHLLAGALYGLNPRLTPATVIEDLIPDTMSRCYYRRYQTPMIFKSHNLPDPALRRVIYLLRDGRDVLVSYYHFMHGKGKTSMTYERMLQHVRPTWREHIEAWTANPFKADMLIVRYEDLQRDTVRELKRMCHFIGIERNDAELARAVQFSTFDMLRAKENEQGWSTPAGTTRSADFHTIRRGKVGSHRDELPAHILDAFTTDNASLLRKLGYP